MEVKIYSTKHSTEWLEKSLPSGQWFIQSEFSQFLQHDATGSILLPPSYCMGCQSQGYSNIFTFTRTHFLRGLRQALLELSVLFKNSTLTLSIAQTQTSESGVTRTNHKLGYHASSYLIDNVIKNT